MWKCQLSIAIGPSYIFQPMIKLLLYIALIAIASSAVFQNKISDRVQRDLSLKNGHTSILVQMKKQLDFETLRNEQGLLAREMSEDARGYFVMESLMKNAKITQKRIIEILGQQKMAYKSYWVQNSITIANCDAKLIHHLALRDDVDYIGSDEWNVMEHVEPIETDVPVGNKDEVEWNVKWIGADKLWALGFDGKGTVIGGADTGIEFNHSALVSNYRGKTGNGFNHNYNWWDGIRDFPQCRSPCGCKISEPCDDHGHGTHTLSTACGGVSKKVGVSPGSKWIGCRPFSDTGRHYSVSTFLACLQFFVAPTMIDGSAPNPTLRPHSTIHSYGCNTQLGCPGIRDLEAASDAMKASGVLMIVAAHNQGPSCSSITRLPAFYKSVITIGATDKNTDNIASYSSRGPIRVDGSNRRKPDLTAPGSQVLGANRRNTFSVMSGTSMVFRHYTHLGNSCSKWSIRFVMVCSSKTLS